MREEKRREAGEQGIGKNGCRVKLEGVKEVGVETGQITGRRRIGW